MPMTIAELERTLRTVEPTVLLASPRLLRRVIKWDRKIPGFGLYVPHRKSYIINRQKLSEIMDEEDLGNDQHFPATKEIILLVHPSAQQLAECSPEELLIHYWRLLFHASIHQALESKFAVGALTAEMLEERIRRLRAAAFDEARLVLGHEELLLPPQSNTEVYVEFAATYWELRFFAPELLPYYFPSLRGKTSAVESVFGEDVDSGRLFLRTRPAGAPEPTWKRDEKSRGEEARHAENEKQAESLRPKAAPSAARFRMLMRKAHRAAAAGNIVRAARYHVLAERRAPPELIERAPAALKAAVAQLCERLQAALSLEVMNKQAFESILLSLMRRTADGIWTPELRLLYDLQKVCLNFERRTYTVNVTRWLFSLGRYPLRRASPVPCEVPMLRHLRAAAGRLPVVRIAEAEREQLAGLLRQAEGSIEQIIRERLRPTIAAVLASVGLQPKNLPETVAANKLIEELLDRIVSHGFLTMGNLRDALSRNNLKLPDLSKVLDFLQGDELLRANRRLADSLGGVYHGGEFYLRWMQRLSAVSFGTSLGRFFTRFFAVPFGGAYVALAGIHELWQLFAHREVAPLEGEIIRMHAPSGFHVAHPSLVLLLGLFLLGVINFAGFRHLLKVFFKFAYRLLSTVVVEPLQRLFNAPWLQELIHGRWFTLAVHFLVKPLFWTALLWWALPGGAAGGRLQPGTVATLFFALAFLLNTRLGRTAEEVVLDWFALSWRRFGLRAITGLFLLVVDFFKGVVSAVEQVLYAVDEWLRYQSSEQGPVLVFKFILGRIWSFVAYVLRFAVNVLIEPQINPIKHFPVVTVSHKLLLPLIPTFAGVLELTLEKALAWTVAATTIWCIPGVFGFLVWELKENWRLYDANRRRELGPTTIGPHAETMLRLLRLGFHSGTLPRYYAKLRHAARRASEGGNPLTVRKHLHALQHVESVIRRWIERDYLALLARIPSWQDFPIALNCLHTTTNSLELAFACPRLNSSFLRIAIQWRGWGIAAGVESPGWAEMLTAKQCRSLEAALAGLYKSAGVDLVFRQHENVPSALFSRQEITAAAGNDAIAAVSNCGGWPSPNEKRNGCLTLQPQDCLLFCETGITWQDWVRYWEEEAAGRSPPPFISYCLLPG